MNMKNPQGGPNTFLSALGPVASPLVFVVLSILGSCCYMAKVIQWLLDALINWLLQSLPHCYMHFLRYTGLSTLVHCAKWLDCLLYTGPPNVESLYSVHGRDVDAGHVALLRHHLECLLRGCVRHEGVLAALVIQNLCCERHHCQRQADQRGDEYPSCVCQNNADISTLWRSR